MGLLCDGASMWTIDPADFQHSMLCAFYACDKQSQTEVGSNIQYRGGSRKGGGGSVLGVRYSVSRTPNSEMPLFLLFF